MSDRFRERLERLANDAGTPRPDVEDVRRRGRRRRVIGRATAGVALAIVAFGLVVPLRGLLEMGSAERNPAASNDAEGYVVFSRQVGDEYGLWLVRPDGSDLHPLDLPLPVATDPSWSPDGTTIALAGSESGNTEPDAIYTVDADGDGLRRVVAASEGSWNGAPSWSPDGQELVFTRTGDPGNEPGTSHLVILNLNREAERAVPLPEDFFQVMEPTWSPGGTQIAFIGNRGDATGPYLVDPDGGNLERLLPERHSASHGMSALSWSPDGSRLAFAQDGDVFVLALTDMAVRQLTDAPQQDTAPGWSPDGSHLVFLSARDRPWQECAWARDGAPPWMVDLCRDTHYLDFMDSDVFVMTADGNDQRPVTEGGGVGYGPFAPSGPSWQPVTPAAGSSE